MHSTTQHTVHIHIHRYTHSYTHTHIQDLRVSVRDRTACCSISVSFSLPDSLSRLRGASPPSYHATSLNRQCTPRTGLLPATQHRPADRASPSTAFPVQLFYLFWTRGQGERGSGPGGQGRAGPSQGLAFLAVVLTLFFLRTFRSGAETKQKVKPPPDWALLQLDRQFVTCRPKPKTASVLRTKLRVMIFPHNSANPPGTRALSL